MSLKNLYPKVVRANKDTVGYDGDELGTDLPYPISEGTVGVVLGEISPSDDSPESDTRLIGSFETYEEQLEVVPDDFTTLDMFDSDYEEFPTISELIDEIGDDWIGTDTLVSLSRVIPVGSFLWFEGEEVSTDGVATTITGMGLGEVDSDFTLVIDPENERELEGPSPITDDEAQAFQVNVYVRPLTFKGSDEGKIETRTINPLRTYVVTRPITNA